MRNQVATNQTELARACGVSPATISRQIDLGVLPLGEIVLGRRRLYSTAQVEFIARYFRERTKGETLGKFSYEALASAPEEGGRVAEAIQFTRKESQQNEER